MKISLDSEATSTQPTHRNNLRMGCSRGLFGRSVSKSEDVVPKVLVYDKNLKSIYSGLQDVL